MKRCLTLLVIKQRQWGVRGQGKTKEKNKLRQIKTTRRYNYTSLKMATMEKMNNSKHWQGF